MPRPFLFPSKIATEFVEISPLAFSFGTPIESPTLKIPPIASERVVIDPLAELRPQDLLKAVGPSRGSLSDRQEPTNGDLASLAVTSSDRQEPTNDDLAPLAVAKIDAVPVVTDIVIYAPATPRWTAESFNNRWTIFGVDTLAVTNRAVSNALATWNFGRQQLDVAVAATPSMVSSFLRPQASGVILSPPALAGPLVSSPQDRLAMASAPKQRKLPASRGASPASRRAPPANASPPPEADTLATPTTLLEQVRLLMQEPSAAAWAIEVETQLDAALAVRPGDVEGFAHVSRNLRRLALEGSDLAEEIDSQRAAVLLRRASYGIFRRLAAWDLTVQIESRHRDALLTHAEQLEGFPPDPFNDARWDQIAHLLTGKQQQLQLNLSPNHLGDFVEVMPTALQTSAPRSLSTNVARPFRLVSWLEEYERRGNPRLAQAIASQLLVMHASEDQSARELGAQVDAQYRNSNFRIAISDKLIARRLPKSSVVRSPLRDRFLGADVRGTTTTKTNLALRLIPDEAHWRLGFEARGTVATHSTSTTGPVSLRSRGHTSFVATKDVAVDRREVVVSAAQCKAKNHTRLVSIETRMDSVPMMSRFVRSRAKERFQKTNRKIRQRTERKVEHRVAKALDQKAGAAIEGIRQQYMKNVVGRAAELGMHVQPVEVRTTESRLIARLRVAANDQLAGHTPRPRAPGDSLASLQLHQSAINNAAAGLELAGRRFTPKELGAHLAERLQAPYLAEVQLQTPPAVLMFSNKQPVTVHLGEGQARLVLAIAELRLGNSRYRNFKVHASYQPHPEGITANIRRTGGLEIEGRLKTSARLKLHGVFGKVLSDKRSIPLLATILDNEKFDDLMITQMVMDDGWLGLAVGPNRPPGVTGERLAVAGRYVR